MMGELYYDDQIYNFLFFICYLFHLTNLVSEGCYEVGILSADFYHVSVVYNNHSSATSDCFVEEIRIVAQDGDIL